MLALGFGIGVQIVIARRYGERNYSTIGKTFDHAMYFLLLLAIFMFVFLNTFGEAILSKLVKSEMSKQKSIESQKDWKRGK